MIPRMIDCGEKLDVVKKQIDFFQELARAHSSSVLAKYMQWYQDTITGLCDEEAYPAANADECTITDATSIHIIRLCLPAVYLGQYERVQFLIRKWDGLSFDEKHRVPWRTILINYYNGLALTGLHRRKKSNKTHISCLQSCISVLDKGKCYTTVAFLACKCQILIPLLLILLQHLNFLNGISRQSSVYCVLKICLSKANTEKQVRLYFSLAP